MIAIKLRLDQIDKSKIRQSDGCDDDDFCDADNDDVGIDAGIDTEDGTSLAWSAGPSGRPAGQPRKQPKLCVRMPAMPSEYPGLTEIMARKLRGHHEAPAKKCRRASWEGAPMRSKCYMCKHNQKCWTPSQRVSVKTKQSI